MKKALKKIELALKGIPIFLLRKRNNPMLIIEPFCHFDSSNIKKVLFLRHDLIGDVIVSLPILRNIKQFHPNIQLDILLSKKNFSVKNSLSKYINKYYCYDKNLTRTVGLLKQIRIEKYDLVIDLFDNSSATSDFFIKFSNAKWYLGIDKENRANYTNVVPLLNKHKVHIVERISQLLLPFGINPQLADLSLEYELTDSEIEHGSERAGEKTKSIRLGINLAGSSPNKYWGLNNNIEFIKYINKNYSNIEVIVFSDIHFRQAAQDIVEKVEAKVAPTVSTFNEFASMVKTCDMILTPDTSVVHLASAWKKPCIALYIHISEKIAMPWYPYKTEYIAITTDSNSLEAIELNKVIEAFDYLIKSFNAK